MNRASIDSPHPPHTAQTWGFRYHRWYLWMLIPKQKRLWLHLWQPYIHTWVPSYCQDHLCYTLSSNWSLLFDMYVYIYIPSGKLTLLNVAIYSGFCNQKWWFSMVMLVYQRVYVTNRDLFSDFLITKNGCESSWFLFANHQR